MMIRTTRLALAAFTTALLAPLGTLHAASKPTPSDKPNIIFIIADDLGYGDVQCQNPEL